MRLRSQLSIALFVAATTVPALAQNVPVVKLPPSPAGQSAVQLGGASYTNGKWVVVDYGRPLLRGRKDIFGSGADYGKRVMDDTSIWRAGANDTTRLTTQVPLQVGGKTVPPGVYNVFVDLKAGAWTLVLNTQPLQERFDPSEKVKVYGAYNYNAKFDVLRAPMTVKASDVSVEQFTIGFVNVGDTRATLSMAWEKTEATVDVAVGK